VQVLEINERRNADDYGGHKVDDYGGHPAPDGASPTQPYKCGQNVKVKVKGAGMGMMYGYSVCGCCRG